MASIDSERLYQELGIRIEKKRKELGLSQAQLAQKIGKERTSISNIESGKQHAPLHTLYELSLILSLS